MKLLLILLTFADMYIVKEARYTGKKNIYKCIHYQYETKIDTVYFINNNLYLKGDTIY